MDMTQADDVLDGLKTQEQETTCVLYKRKTHLYPKQKAVRREEIK